MAELLCRGKNWNRNRVELSLSRVILLRSATTIYGCSKDSSSSIIFKLFEVRQQRMRKNSSRILRTALFQTNKSQLAAAQCLLSYSEFQSSKQNVCLAIVPLNSMQSKESHHQRTEVSTAFIGSLFFCDRDPADIILEQCARE